MHKGRYAGYFRVKTQHRDVGSQRYCVIFPILFLHHYFVVILCALLTLYYSHVVTLDFTNSNWIWTSSAGTSDAPAIATAYFPTLQRGPFLPTSSSQPTTTTLFTSTVNSSTRVTTIKKAKVTARCLTLLLRRNESMDGH